VPPRSPLPCARPDPRSPHFALFDSLRAIAVAGVLVVHLGTVSRTNFTEGYGLLTSQGRIGVHIFFVISAFLLYRPHAVAFFDGGPSPTLRTYVRRRLLRILPAYWVALTLLALWPGLRDVFTSRWWIYYGLLQGYRVRSWWGGIPPAWSLSIELAFYAALPLLAWMLARAAARAPSLRAGLLHQIVAISALGIGSQLFQIWVQVSGHESLQLVLPSMFLCFAAGMVLALLSAWVGSEERRWAAARWVADHPGSCWVAAVAVFAAGCLSPAFVPSRMVNSHTPLTHFAEQVLYAAIAVLIVLPGVFGETSGGWPRRLLASRGCQWLGRISYGVFLWHLPLITGFAARGGSEWISGWPMASLALVGVPLSLFFGWASYRWVEQPAMRWR